jgi:hypothetical protein
MMCDTETWPPKADWPWWSNSPPGIGTPSCRFWCRVASCPTDPVTLAEVVATLTALLSSWIPAGQARESTRLRRSGRSRLLGRLKHSAHDEPGEQHTRQCQADRDQAELVCEPARDREQHSSDHRPRLTFD